jgi:hypothetical protein
MCATMVNGLVCSLSFVLDLWFHLQLLLLPSEVVHITPLARYLRDRSSQVFCRIVTRLPRNVFHKLRAWFETRTLGSCEKVRGDFGLIEWCVVAVSCTRHRTRESLCEENAREASSVSWMHGVIVCLWMMIDFCKWSQDAVRMQSAVTNLHGLRGVARADG